MMFLTSKHVFEIKKCRDFLKDNDLKQSSFGLPGQYGRRVKRANLETLHRRFKHCFITGTAQGVGQGDFSPPPPPPTFLADEITIFFLL